MDNPIPPPSYPPRSCGRCGMLASRDQLGVLREVDIERRNNVLRDAHGNSSAATCFAGASDFFWESTVETPDGGLQQRGDTWDHILKKDRSDCPSFIEYRQRYTPREHADILDRQIRDAREDARDRQMRAWQAEQNLLARQFEEEERERDREHQSKLTEDTNSIQRSMVSATKGLRTLTFTAVIISAVALVASVLMPLLQATDSGSVTTNINLSQLTPSMATPQATATP